MINWLVPFLVASVWHVVLFVAKLASSHGSCFDTGYALTECVWWHTIQLFPYRTCIGCGDGR